MRGVVAIVAIIVGGGVIAIGYDGRASATGSGCPASRAAMETYCGFSVTRPPGPGFRPFSKRSPFNTRVGAHPTVSPQSAEIVANSYLERGQPSAIVNEPAPQNDYSHPVFYASLRDPVVTIHGGALSGTRVRIPAYARNAEGSDRHLSVVQPDGWEIDLWGAGLAESTLTASTSYRQRYDGLGVVPSPPPARTTGGGTASYFAASAGVIRAAELRAGRIDHALFLSIDQGSQDTSFGFGTRAPGANGRGGEGSSVYPAIKGDGAAPGVRPPMGARYWLDMTPAEIDRTGAPAWERTIAKAMHAYGGYFGDTGGGGFKFALESAVPYVSAGQPNPMAAVAAQAGIGKEPGYG